MPDTEFQPRSETSGLTQRDLLLELRADVKAMTEVVGIMSAQDLGRRVDKLESWADRVDGRVSALMVAVTVMGTVIGIVGGLLAVARFVIPEAG